MAHALRASHSPHHDRWLVFGPGSNLTRGLIGPVVLLM